MSVKPQVQKVYPLSPMQEGILFQTLVNPNSEAYFEQLRFTVHGGLDPSLFQKSLAVLSEQYEVFRTSFVHEKVRRPIQVVLTERPVTFQYEEITAMAETAKASYCDTYSRTDRQKGFDLLKESLVRVSVIRTHAQRYRVIWSFHHIIMDGWCIGIVLTDFFAVYQMLLEGRPPLLPKAPPYSDYIEWLDRQDKQAAFAHWEKYLDGYETIAVVPKSHSNPVNAGYCQAEHEISLDESLNLRLQQTAAQYHVTINTVCQAIWGLLLQRYNNTRDVVFGVVVSGRPAEIGEIERRVGLYINTIPVRIQTGSGASFSQLIKQVQQTGNTMERYSYFQLAEIQSRSSLKQDLIDHLYIFENFPLFEGVSAGAQDLRLPFRTTDFQLFEQTNYHFNVLINPGTKTRIKFSYNSNVHHLEWVRRIGGHFRNLLEQGLADPNQRVAGLEILTPAEKEQILAGFNQTQSEYPRGKTIAELFEAQVARDPGSVALEFQDQVCSYGELDQRSNQLARKLREKGAWAGRIVAIMPRRSPEMLIGIMAILKAGAAYLPIDPEYPRERIEYMLADSQTSILLTTGLPPLELDFQGEVVDLEDGGLYQGDCSGLERWNCATDLAYIIYTSGSTGKPKGVMVEQRALHNFIAGVIRRIEFAPGKTILAVTTISFDIFGLETLPPLTQGGTIIIATEAQQRDPRQLSQLIAKRRIRMLQFTPSRIQLLLSDSAYLSCLESVTELMMGGEALPESMAQELRKWTRAKIYNMYGPTETTIWSTIQEINEAAEITIGTPMANTQVLILDQDGQWQPVGIAGELCIAGDGLARGYLNRPELTGEKFVVRAFRETPQRIYRTGDLARWLPDGNIEFLGRRDQQVKIRGYRIELGEIESRLLKHAAVKEAVVVEKTGPDGNKYLCAYVVWNEAPTVAVMRDYLKQELPDYMIPSYFMGIERIPLTLSGKIDRKALPEPSGSLETGTAYVAPRNETEAKLVSIWQEILNTGKIGVDDEFFELGGDSLKALRVATEANSQNINLSIPDIFTYKTIAKLVENLENAPKSFPAGEENGPAKGAADSDAKEASRYEWAPDMAQLGFPEAKELKILIQRDITIFMHRVNHLCVVLADPNLWPWFYEHFINIQSTTDLDGRLSLDYHELFAAHRDILREYSLSMDMVAREPDLIRFIIEKINKELYLYMAVDEYYLPGKLNYHQTHHIQHNLVYGYDNRRQTFKVLGFDTGAGRLFSEMNFRYSDFLEGLTQGLSLYRETLRENPNGWVVLYERRTFEGPYPFSLHRFLNQLNNYLCSRGNDSINYFWAANDPKINYGMQVYDEVLRHLENLLQGKMTLDYRAIHLLTEHKNILARRFQYLMERYLITGKFGDLYSEFLEVAAEFNKLRIKSFDLQNNVSAAHTDLSELGKSIRELMVGIQGAKEKEQSIVAEMYRILKTMLPEYQEVIAVDRAEDGFPAREDYQAFIKSAPTMERLKPAETGIPETQELQIVLQREVTVPLHRAVPLCMVLINPKLRPWFYEHYINVFSHTGADGFLSVDYMEAPANHQDIILGYLLSPEMVDREPDLVRFLSEKISQEFYVWIQVDEFYIPGKPSYHAEHRVAPNLVYGYDNIGQKFTILNFEPEAEGVSPGLEADYKCLVEAYQQGCLRYQDLTADGEQAAVVLYEYFKRQIPYPFSLSRFITELSNYLNSVGDDSTLYFWGLKGEIHYGFAVYEQALRHLENRLEGKMTIDEPAIQLLFEHKKLLAQRFEFIIDQYQITGRLVDLLSRFQEVVAEFNRLWLTFRDLESDDSTGVHDPGEKWGPAIREITGLLRSARDRERAILPEMYQILKTWRG